jgi:hypothetical protein
VLLGNGHGARVIQQNRLIDPLDADFGPGAAEDEGILKVEVEEARPNWRRLRQAPLAEHRRRTLAAPER